MMATRSRDISGRPRAAGVPQETQRAGPREHALTCYASSVFENLDITLATDVAAPLISVDPEAVSRRGFDTRFLSSVMPIPRLSSALTRDSVKLDGDGVIPYTHCSLGLLRSKKFARWVACVELHIASCNVAGRLRVRDAGSQKQCRARFAELRGAVPGRACCRPPRRRAHLPCPPTTSASSYRAHCRDI